MNVKMAFICIAVMAILALGAPFAEAGGGGVRVGIGIGIPWEVQCTILPLHYPRPYPYPYPYYYSPTIRHIRMDIIRRRPPYMRRRLQHTCSRPRICPTRSGPATILLSESLGLGESTAVARADVSVRSANHRACVRQSSGAACIYAPLAATELLQSGGHADSSRSARRFGHIARILLRPLFSDCFQGFGGCLAHGFAVVFGGFLQGRNCLAGQRPQSPKASAAAFLVSGKESDSPATSTGMALAAVFAERVDLRESPSADYGQRTVLAVHVFQQHRLGSGGLGPILPKA